MKKSLNKKKLTSWLAGGLSALGVLALTCGLVFGLDEALDKKETNGITEFDTWSNVFVGELYNGDNKFNSSFNQLMQYLSGDSTASASNMNKISTMATTKSNASVFRDKAIADKTSGLDITVTLGGLKWQAMYLSKDKDNNDILTLWLSNSNQAAFVERDSTEGNYHGFINGGLYSSWSGNWYNEDASIAYPSNMYGTSYVRAITLNNGGLWTEGSGNTTNINSYEAEKSYSSVFAPFTMGELAEYIVTPENISWQEYQSGKDTQNTNNNNSNDAWSNSMPDNGFYSSSCNYAHKNGNDNWKNDKLWLPSITEVGRPGYTTGIWGVSTDQLMNYDGSTSSSIGNVGVFQKSSFPGSLLRSGGSNSAFRNSVIATNALSLYSVYVHNSYAVRPALHLNLTKIAPNVLPPTNWNEIADTSWSGEGTEASPYLVDSAEKLAGLAAKCVNNDLLEGKYFKQTADISLGGYDWTPIGLNSSKAFKGIYDGGGYHISNIILNELSTGDLGLFGYVSSVIIKNVNIVECYLKNQSSDYVTVGSIAGYLAQGGIIENCSSNAKIKVGSEATYVCAGGIVGAAGTDTNVENCVFTGTINIMTANSQVGGIAGYFDSVNNYIKNCNVTSASITGGTCGGIVGSLGENSKVKLCMLSGVAIEGFSRVGGVAGQSRANSVIESTLIRTNIYIDDNSISTGGVVGFLLGATTITNCSVLSGSNFDIEVFYGGETVPTINNCYGIMNTSKVYKGTDFSGFGIVAGMNNGLPMQRELFFMAEVAPTFDVGWFAENGFTKVA